MTQVATPGTVIGKFDGTTVNSAGLSYRVSQTGNELTAEMPDPDVMMYVVQGGKKLAFSEIPRVERPVVLATGSHHYQTYWVASSRYQGLLQTLPLVFLKEDQRWAPREAVFLRGPADQDRLVTQWNHHCIRCHSTAGNPGLDEGTGRLNSTVAELGIACESCHGPGQDHVSKQRAIAVSGTNAARRADSSIVNPATLTHKRSTMVCGQCHGVYITRDEFAMRSAKEAALYKPGENLHLTRHYVTHPGPGPSPKQADNLRRNLDFYRERWWDDGTILAGGREYTALLATACYLRGGLSCLSCHSMHRSSPEGQLKSGADGPSACVSCHSEARFTTDVRTHTFHPPHSSGSNCLNCHMPHTTYALFRAIRSHQITSPSVESSARHGTPNACNLCHLDKSLGWTQQHLSERHRRPAFPLSPEQENISAAVLWLVKGNAAQRTIAAWHTGWKSAQEAAGTNWLAPYCSLLLKDPYGVTRYVAARSIRSLPGYDDFEFDFLAPEPALLRYADGALNRWKASTRLPQRHGPTVLLTPAGDLMEPELFNLLRQRDDRSVTIKE